jgi:hypothetical protein
MTDTAAESRAQFRWSVYLLLITISTGAMLGRIFAVDAVNMQRLEESKLQKIPGDLEKKRHELEKNGLVGGELNRELARIESRWQQQARLRRPFLSSNDRSRWCTVRALVEKDMQVEGAPYAIDRVIQQPNWDTIDMVKHDGHLYSSKPPLLPTLMAAVYWPIYHFTGATLGTHPYEIGRFMLVLFNVVPMIVYFVVLARLIERLGSTDWGRMFVMASAAFGTFLTTFAVTINNHLIGAVCAAVAIDAVVRVWFDDQRRPRYFVLAGIFGALAAVDEFPALSLLAVLALALLWKAPRPTLLGFAPAVLLVAIAFFATNWIAHGCLAPAYLHHDWYDYSFERGGKQVDSYWRHPSGIDRGEASRGVYALQVLIGHHGIFSLTPVWILSFIGTVAWMWRGRDVRLRWMAAAVGAISLACLAFYLGQPLATRNYGGMTSGLRWMFWLAPMWLLVMLPAVDGLAARRWTRGLALVLLAFSVLSASYPTWNPWTHPWLMNFMQYLGWV